jgi:hypothetical protein
VPEEGSGETRPFGAKEAHTMVRKRVHGSSAGGGCHNWAPRG